MGHLRVSDVEYPPNENNRSFNNMHYTRHLPNGEKHNRSWLVYSKEKNTIFCFCCVLFNKGLPSALTTAYVGYNDWKNVHSRLKEHEKSVQHINCMTYWMEAELRLKKKITIDSSNKKAINKEKEYWRKVLKKNLCVVKALASSNLAFRGDNEKIDDSNNGIFLHIVKMIGEFDPIMEEHLRRIRKKELRRNHYLGHNIQNEMILLLAGEVKKLILKIVKEAKYFSVILDCTPDISHNEQMTIVLRCVDVSTSPIKVQEFFLDFLKKFEFLVGMVIWYEILAKVNKVSKLLQKKDMIIDVVITLIKGLIVFFEEYRGSGFETAKIEAEKIAIEMKIEPKFQEPRVRMKKKFFDEKVSDEPIDPGEDYFRVNFFIFTVDNAISSLKTRFEQFTKYDEIFGFLFDIIKLKSTNDDNLKNYCATLEAFLKDGDNCDIDGEELFIELQLLRKSLPEGITTSIEIWNI